MGSMPTPGDIRGWLTLVYAVGGSYLAVASISSAGHGVESAIIGAGLLVGTAVLVASRGR